MKTYSDFYPSRLTRDKDFIRHAKNRENFEDFCLGKNEWFYKEEGNYGYERNAKHLTEVKD
jgi:hypothetical protein